MQYLAELPRGTTLATARPSDDCAVVSESGNNPVKTQTSWPYTREYLATIGLPVSVDNFATTVGLRRSDQGIGGPVKSPAAGIWSQGAKRPAPAGRHRNAFGMLPTSTVDRKFMDFNNLHQ